MLNQNKGPGCLCARAGASIAVGMSLLLVACGGGGGGGGTAAPPPPTNSAPTLTGNLAPEFSENEDIMFFLSVDDADGDTVTLTVGNSTDGQFFTPDTGMGEIRSTQQFDFEMPEDANGDNVYEQSVMLNDGTTTVTAAEAVRIGPVRFQFNSLATSLATAPDIDGDGLPELYLRSTQLLQEDPPGLSILLLSSDVTAVLGANGDAVDLEPLFFNESP